MTVTKKKEGLLQTDAIIRKQERARDGTQAWEEYEAEARAVAERTARLRALRLAKAAEGSQKAARSAGPTTKKGTVGPRA
jgi:hypothetical protein